MSHGMPTQNQALLAARPRVEPYSRPGTARATRLVVTLGHQAPHVSQIDGLALYDRFGRDWTLLRLVGDGSVSWTFLDTARHLGVPVIETDLAAKPLAKKLYERNSCLLDLIRDAANGADANRILRTVTGKSPHDDV